MNSYTLPIIIKELGHESPIFRETSVLFISSPHGAKAPSGTGPPHYRGFTITLRHPELGKTFWTSDQPEAETRI